MKKQNITKVKCKRCSHEWPPRQEVIRVCPKCKSAWWDVKKKKS